MQRYQTVIRFADDTEKVLILDANRVRDMLDAYGIDIEGVTLEDGEAVDGKCRATWFPVDNKPNVCPCRCNYVVKAEGKFRPGHDARLVGNLLRQVRNNEITRDRAMRDLARWPKLQEKLTRYLDR